MAPIDIKVRYSIVYAGCTAILSPLRLFGCTARQELVELALRRVVEAVQGPIEVLPTPMSTYLNQALSPKPNLDFCGLRATLAINNHNLKLALDDTSMNILDVPVWNVAYTAKFELPNDACYLALLVRFSEETRTCFVLRSSRGIARNIFRFLQQAQDLCMGPRSQMRRPFCYSSLSNASGDSYTQPSSMSSSSSASTPNSDSPPPKSFAQRRRDSRFTSMPSQKSQESKPFSFIRKLRDSIRRPRMPNKCSNSLESIGSHSSLESTNMSVLDVSQCYTPLPQNPFPYNSRKIYHSEML